jgi:long-chain fatty acid transport protein
MRRSLAIAGAAAVACVAAGGPLQAQGSSVEQQSACLAGRVSAGLAIPCDDGSAVFFSPGAITTTGGAVSAGLALIHAGGSFRYDPAMIPASGEQEVERESETVPVPQFYINYPVNPRLAVGFAALAPFGLGLEWPVCAAETPSCGETNFEGRFTGYDNAIRGFYLQPTVGYQIIPGTLSVGAGLDYVIGTIDVHRRQFGPEALGLGNTEVADVYLSGDGSALTYNVGAHLMIGGGTALAIRYLGSAEVDLDGDADFTQVSTGNAGIDAQIAGGLPADQGVSTVMELPGQVGLGVGHRFSDRLALMFDFQRTYWSSFDAFPVDFESAADDTLNLNYNDANTFRLGAEFSATDALVLRAGWRYNEAATPRATPFLPEGERNYYSVGLGYRVTRGLSTDFSFQYVNQPDRAGALIPEGPRAGVYSATGTVFNFTLAYRFGGGN